MNTLLVLPILIPLTGTAIAFLFHTNRAIQRRLGLASAGGFLVADILLAHAVWHDGIQTAQLGNWPAPFGITLVADLFSAIMLLMTGIVAICVATYSIVTIGKPRERFDYYPLFNLLLAGVSGAFLTGDLFNLYVWFEVMLIASFVLLALGGEADQMRGGLKYVAINLVSSALFLSAIGILYGLTGTLNMADLALKLDSMENSGLTTTVAILFLIVFGVKAALFPLFFWLPDSYHTPPVPVSAVFAGLLTKVGVYAIIRVFTLLFVQEPNYTHTLILVLSGLTMITGVLGAVAQQELRRILSFHIISQIGYMILGLGLFTVVGLAGSIFYIAHHIIVKTNLFLIGGIVAQLRGTFELKELGGMYTSHPFLGVLFLVPALSLAGMPPLSGFFAKLSLLKAGFQAEQLAIVTIALLVGFLTLYSMTKIWANVFWGRPTPSKPVTPNAPNAWTIAPVVLLAGLTVGIGLAAGPLFAVSLRAAEQLIQREDYIRAVLSHTHDFAP